MRYICTSIVATLMLALVGTTAAHAATLNVPGDYATIQEAVDAAGFGDEVVISPGTYYESVNISNQLTVRSLTSAAETTIDGESGSAIFCSSSNGSVTLIGLTLTAGSPGIYLSYTSATVQECIIADCASTGLFFQSSGSGSGHSLIVQDSIIENNVGLDAGGLCRLGGGSAVITGCVFRGNIGAGDSGGAMRVDGGTLTLVGNEFVDNTAERGAGISIGNSANIQVTDCRFDANIATYGGAVYGHNGAFEACVFTNNQANNGAAMFLIGSSCSILSSEFDYNHASNGGAVYLESGNAHMTSCYLRNNTGLFGGGGVYVYGGGAYLQDTVVCGNSVDQIYGYWEDQGGSCVTDTCDDLNQDSIPDACQCLGDISGDGQVTVNEVLLVISEWGSDESEADVDGNGTVDITDLLIVLSAWGPCP